MEIFFKHAWVMFIAVTCVNGLLLKNASQRHIAKNPALAAGYNKYIKGWFLYGNIPWLIMMVGSISGQTQSLFEYLSPRQLNPVVLVFHLSIVALWGLGIRWIYFKQGAEFLEQHPGLIRKSSLSGNTTITASQIKRFFPLTILGGLVGMIMMWVIDLPIS